MKSVNINGKKVVYEAILETIAGGVGLNIARLDSQKVDVLLGVDKRYLPGGTPVYVNLATRVAEVCKSALAVAGGAATAVRVTKDQHFKVGDLLNDGVTSSHITAVDQSNAGYDVLTTAEAVIFAAGTKYVEGGADGASTALKFTPNGLTKNDVFIADGNADASIVVIGTVRADSLSYPLPASYATALRGNSSLITIV